MSGLYTIILVIHTILVLFLIGIVLLQRSDSDGLSGLGGGGGNQFLTGRSSANLLTRTTAILAGAFMVTSLILAVMVSRGHEGESLVDSMDAVPAVTQPAPEKPQEPAAPKPE